MIKISKQEAFDMRKICGQEAVKKSYSKHPTYYLVESKENLRSLNKYRYNKTIK